MDRISHREDLLKAIAKADALPPAKYPQEQWRVAKALFRVLRRALVELKLVFAERGECDFTEVALLAKDALETEGGVSDLAVALGMELRHLLMDEMQDTSTSQYELIELLTQGWDGHGARRCFWWAIRSSRFICFGRRGWSGLCGRWRRSELGELPVGLLRLTANFRSQRGLVERSMRIFAAVSGERFRLRIRRRCRSRRRTRCVGRGLMEGARCGIVVRCRRV